MVRSLGAARKRLYIEFIDIVEQFDEPARAMVEQLLALFRRGERGIADRAAFVKVLRLPGKWSGPVRRNLKVHSGFTPSRHLAPKNGACLRASSI